MAPKTCKLHWNLAPRWLLLLVFGLFTSCSQLFAAPLLNEPKFSQLSTESGLSQDSINTMIIDQEGFLWLGTEAGLNRYDGYKVKAIGFDSVALDELAITALMQDSAGNLWVGTATSGVYQIDMQRNEVKKIGQWSFKEEPDWLQYAVQFIEDGNGDVWVALNEQVVRISSSTPEEKVVFTLPDYLLEEDHIVRNILRHEDILLVATSEGLFGVDARSGEFKKIDYLDSIPANINNTNAKFLTLHQAEQLLIGTVEGLYSLPFSAIKSFVFGQGKSPTPSLKIPELNIWTMLAIDDDRYTLGTHQGLYNFSVESDQLEYLFKPTDSRLLLTDDDLVTLARDENNNLWMGTLFDGALYWSPKSTQFTNVINKGRGQSEFSGSNVWSFHQQNEQHLWVGTGNGLNLYNLDNGDIQAYLVGDDSKAIYSSSTIDQILPAPDDQLWLMTGEGLSLFDTTHRKLIPVPAVEESSKDIVNSIIYGGVVDDQGDLWFLNSDGIYKYDVETAVVTMIESIDPAINTSMLENIIINQEAFPNSLLVTETGSLWRYDLITGQFELIHSLPDIADQHFTAPDSVALDSNNVLWIAYPGYGLFGIDLHSRETKHQFSQRNLLPGNSIYGLQKDSEGNIWMSSHRGILKFYPDNQHLQRFGYAEGVATAEFNQWANLILQDNRMVYGSQKGMTMFDPSTLQRDNPEAFDVVITGIDVASSANRYPLSNLAGHSIVLEHSDVGITFSFSTLAFHHQKSTQYRYRLTGKNAVDFPLSREPMINFSRLEPGDYQFSVSALNPVSGRESQPSYVNITVKYAIWASPLAYSLYSVLAIAIFTMWWYRRKLHSARILAAHTEVLNTKNRLSLALTASNSNVWEWRESNDSFIAPRINEELGYAKQDKEVSLNDHLALIHPQDRTLFESMWNTFIDDPQPGLDVTYRLRAFDKSWLWFRDVGRAIVAKNGKKVVVGTYTNITENLANIEKVRLFGEAFKHTRDWVVIFDEQCRPIAANQAFCEVFGIDEHGDLDQQMKTVFEFGSAHAPRFWTKLLELKETEHWKGEEHLELSSGKKCDVLINMTSVASMRAQGEVDYFLMIMSDISEQKEAENELRQMANFDSLTSLPNRTLLLDRINHAIDHATRHENTIGLFFIDLDKFKQVNDSLGHKAGDELLKVVAQRLTNLLRQDDTVARLGGDEFVVMVEDVTQPDKLSMLAQEIISIVEAPIQLGNQTVSVSSSVGIALFPNDASTSEELLKNADVAMYHAKEQGRSNFQYFTAHMNELAQARLSLENKLKHAHQHKEFENYYQPIVSLNSGRVEGFELLMRWPTDDGMIPPDQFIPVAEELGLIENMTWDALERAMPWLSEWQHQGSKVYLSVNLSARHFERQISIEHILQLLDQHQLDVSSLRFEITESALMKDYEKSLEYMQNMREHGFVIALDDFGTGYSSLKYLKEFPIQVLKVDKSFVDDIGKNKSNEALVLTTLRMADSLNMYCVAEGIEEQNQIDFFKFHGCDFLQGYFFSKPVPADQTNELLAQSWLA